MPYNFTGSDSWVATLTGPANTDDLTAESCTDMAVQLANRTLWLANRIDDSHQWLHVQRTDTADTGSAYGVIDSVVGAAAWSAMATYYEATVAVGSDACLLRLVWAGTVENTNSDWGEVRLTCGNTIAAPDDVSPHVRVGPGSKKSVTIELITDPTVDLTGSVAAVGLVNRAEEVDGVMRTIGSGRLDIWKMIKTEIP